jgi:hypothetical protein
MDVWTKERRIWYRKEQGINTLIYSITSLIQLEEIWLNILNGSSLGIVMTRKDISNIAPAAVLVYFPAWKIAIRPRCYLFSATPYATVCWSCSFIGLSDDTSETSHLL